MKHFRRKCFIWKVPSHSPPPAAEVHHRHPATDLGSLPTPPRHRQRKPVPASPPPTAEAVHRHPATGSRHLWRAGSRHPATHPTENPQPTLVGEKVPFNTNRAILLPPAALRGFEIYINNHDGLRHHHENETTDNPRNPQARWIASSIDDVIPRMRETDPSMTKSRPRLAEPAHLVAIRTGGHVTRSSNQKPACRRWRHADDGVIVRDGDMSPSRTRPSACRHLF